MRAQFAGLWLPLITPFSNQQVDHPALRRLVAHYARTGLTGLVVCATTGEAPALSAAEQLAVLASAQASAAASPGQPRLRVLMGVSGYHLGDTCAWARQLAGLAQPPEALLVSAPHYIRPSQQGLIDWFCQIADAAGLPLLVYDIPYRTGATLQLDTLRALASHPLIVGIKDCGGDATKTQALMADGQLQVLAGEDAQLFNTLAQGGAGAIAASLHLVPTQLVELRRLIAKGELVPARALWRQLLPLLGMLFDEPNPAPIKAMLAAQGWIANALRAPMTPASPALVARLAQALQGLDG